MKITKQDLQVLLPVATHIITSPPSYTCVHAVRSCVGMYGCTAERRPWHPSHWPSWIMHSDSITWFTGQQGTECRVRAAGLQTQRGPQHTAKEVHWPQGQRREQRFDSGELPLHLHIKLIFKLFKKPAAYLTTCNSVITIVKVVTNDL